jgi:hypothetical protein
MRTRTLILLPPLLALGCSAASAPTMSSAELGGLTFGAVDRMSVDQGTPPLELDEDSKPTGGEGRKLVRRAWLTFEVDDEKEIAARITNLRRRIEGLGGYVSNEHATGATLRVPAEKLDATLETLASEGTLLDRGLQVDEVTREYVDLEARLKSARHTHERLGALLEKAQNVEEILKVEKELGRVGAEIESMEAALRTLKQQVALATIEVHYRTEASPGPIGWAFVGIYRGVKWLFVWD